MKKILFAALFLVACGATPAEEPTTFHPVPIESLKLQPTVTSTPDVTPSPTPTPDPWDDAVACNDSHTKFLMCHVPSGNPNEKDLKCLKRHAIEEHLEHHPLDFLVVDHDTAEGCTESN